MGALSIATLGILCSGGSASAGNVYPFELELDISDPELGVQVTSEALTLEVEDDPIQVELVIDLDLVCS